MIWLLVGGIVLCVAIAAVQVMAEANLPTGSGRLPGLGALILAAVFAAALVVVLILKFAGLY